MSENDTEFTQAEELWLYVSDPEAVFDFLRNPPGPVPETHRTEDIGRAIRLTESIRAIRRPHRARISAKQELWYALVRVRLELGDVELHNLLRGYVSDIHDPSFRKAAEFVTDSADSVDST